MNKEQWIEEVLNSTVELKNNRLSHDIYNNVLSKINQKNAYITNYNKLKWISVAAVLLVFLNIGSVLHAKTLRNQHNKGINILVDELNANNSYNY